MCIGTNKVLAHVSDHTTPKSDATRSKNKTGFHFSAKYPTKSYSKIRYFFTFSSSSLLQVYKDVYLIVFKHYLEA